MQTSATPASSMARPGLPNRPRLRRCYVVQVIEDPPALFLLSEHRHHVFEGAVYLQLAPLLDGSRTLAEVLEEIGDRVPLAEVYQAAFQLMRRGCLSDAAEGRPLDNLPFWDTFFVVDRDVAAGLGGATVRLAAFGVESPQAWVEAWPRSGLQLRPDGSLDVILTDDYLRSELREQNARALREQRTWMLVKPVGSAIWIGPVFRPGQTACWQCLEQRLRANRQLELHCRESGKWTEIQRAAPGEISSSRRMALSLAAIELAKRLVLPDRGRPEAKILSLDLDGLRLEEHLVVRRPQCPACGAPETACLGAQQVALTSRPKKHGHRCADPEETFQRLKHHISPISGAVSALHSRGSSSFGLSHNCTAAHFFPVPDGDVRTMQENTFARSGGKGTSEIEAKTSTLCEALERYSGIRWGEERVIGDSYRNLRGQAIHPREIQLFSERQYAHRAQSNQRILSNQQYVPEPLDDDAVIAWSAAWSLAEERFVHLPTGYCFYGHRDPGHYFTRCDSNGNAAGNNLEEAILQGFLELVERDAVAIWWYNRIPRPAVDVASFGLEYWERMQSYYQRQLNREVHVLDITADLEIPTFAVISRRRDRAVEDIIVGFAAHLDPKTALLRALVEANQSLPALSLTNPDGSTRYYTQDVPEAIEWWQTATYANQPYLVPDESVRARTLGDFPQLARPDVMLDVETCLRIAVQRNLNILVVDQTRPDIELSVAKVVVPGLRHFWRRLAPGRLYDVPVALGWLPEPRKESELNPTSCFL